MAAMHAATFSEASLISMFRSELFTASAQRMLSFIPIPGTRLQTLLLPLLPTFESGNDITRFPARLLQLKPLLTLRCPVIPALELAL